MIPDGKYQPQAQHVPHQRASPIANEGKRDTGNRQKTDGHSNILEDVEGNHADNTHTKIGIKIIFRFHAYLCNMVDQKKK